jgi:hypothetical protein
MSIEAEFQKLVETQVAQHLHHSKSWWELLYSLPSIYPGLVFDTAKRLGLREMIDFDAPSTGSTGNGKFVSESWSAGLLPTPHPVDAAWWFTDSTLDELSRRLLKTTSVSDKILLLGTPTLFHFMRPNVANRQIILVDRHPSKTSEPWCSKSITLDLLASQPKFSRPATVILADPPWYTIETQAFLLMARRNATENTRILLSVPPPGTRPGVQSEWNQIVGWAQGIGLRLTDYRHGALTYLSPPFEQNALYACGVPGCPLDWRRGDLAIFSCDEVGFVPPPRAFTAESLTWQEILIGNVSLRMRPTPQIAGDDAILKTLISGNVLHSVSRRDPLLKSVNIWTSGNRVFTCAQWSKLGHIFNALVNRECPEAYVRKELGADLNLNQISKITDIAKRLLDIVEIEEYELADWKRKTNGDMAKPAS